MPVVATAVGGTPEVIADSETGWLVPPGDAKAIAEKVGLLLQDTAMRAKFGATGRRRMTEQFTFAAQAAQYMRLFESLSGQRRQAA
jgi:glycosyltransferase involved in cell wall biosynthesis